MPSDARCTHNTIPLAPRTGEAAFVPCPWLLARSRRAGREGAGSLCIGRCGGLPPRAARVVCAIRLPAAEGRLKPYVRPLRGCPPLRFAGDTAHPRRGWHLLGRSPSDGPMPRRPPRAARVVCAIRLPAAESRLKPYVRPLRGCLPLRLAGDTAHPRRGSHLLGRSLSMGRCRAGGCSGQSWRARKLFPWWR